MGTITYQSHSMRYAKSKELIVFVICLTCIFLFLSSAYSKVTDHDRFVRGLSNVPFIGPLAAAVAWLVPLAEILIVVLLIIPKTNRLGLYAFAGLMAVFTMYIGGMMLWADKLPCNCNLFVEKLRWGQHLIFNIVFTTLSIVALYLSKRK